MKDLTACQESGEVVKPSRKKRSDAGVPHKRKLTKQNGRSSKQAKNGRVAKSREYIPSTDEETQGSDEDGMDK